MSLQCSKKTLGRAKGSDPYKLFVNYSDVTTNQIYHGETKKRRRKMRLNLDMPVNVRRRMEELKVETDSDSLAEVIRRSAALYDFMITHKKDGFEAILRDEEGNEKLVEFF